MTQKEMQANARKMLTKEIHDLKKETVELKNEIKKYKKESIASMKHKDAEIREAELIELRKMLKYYSELWFLDVDRFIDAQDWKDAYKDEAKNATYEQMCIIDLIVGESIAKLSTDQLGRYTIKNLATYHKVLTKEALAKLKKFRKLKNRKNNIKGK